MTEVLGTVVSTVVSAASTHQQQQQESGDLKPEKQQSSIDMEGLRNKAPDVSVLYNSMYDVYSYTAF